MHHAVALWNWMHDGFPEAGPDVAELAEQFADGGFDAIAVQMHLVEKMPPETQQRLADIATDRGLRVALHEQRQNLVGGQLGRAADLFGDTLDMLSLDRSYTETSCGRLIDAAELVEVLQAGRARLPGHTRITIEDFPLDAAAIDHFHASLAPLLCEPAYGLLLDAGHMNMRLHSEPYFMGQSAAEYVGLVPLPIYEVHLHDNDGRRDLHAPLGSGCLDLAGLVAGLREVDFDEWVTVEVCPCLHGARAEDGLQAAFDALAAFRNAWDLA
jgi:sugar phosphate isomerase/epimerase